MATNLLPISSDGGFITAGNITTASYASPAPTLSGFSTVSSDNIRLMNGDITGGIATVVDDGINSIALALGAQMDVFGFPFSQITRGQLTISGVTTPSEVNGTWYYQSVNTNTYQIYTDSTYSTLVDATGWSAYTGGGTVAITKQVPAANIVINTNGYLTKFDNTGNLTAPGTIIGSFAGNGGNITYQQTNTFYVDPDRTQNYTPSGSQIQPFFTITAAITAATNAGYNDTNPAFIILLESITEDVTLKPGIWLTSLGTGTHGSPIITGTVTVTSSTGSLSSNHYSISNLRIVAPTNGHCILFTGTSPQKLFIRDMWMDANGTGDCIYMDNSNSTSTVQMDIAHLTHSGSGDIYCINVTAGNCYVTDIETSGATQVSAVGSGAVMTIDGSELDANGDVVCETYGTGSLTITNSIITNTQANGNGIKINAAGSTVTIGNCLFSIPTGTGSVIWYDSGATLYGSTIAYAGITLVPGTNTTVDARLLPVPLTTLPGTIANPVFAGNITSTTAGTWTLVDNNSSSLSFDTTGKTGVLKLITTNSAEGVTMSGYANVTGNLNVAGNIVGNLASGNSNIVISANSNVVTSVTGAAILTVYSGGIKVGGSGVLQSPGGASALTLNNNGANIPTANITTFANVTGASGLNVVANIAAGNISTTGNISGNTNGYTIGYLNIPQVAASNTTIALTDAGKHYYSTTAGNFTLTVPNNTSTAFATGTAISIVVQAAGNILVNAASGVTLYMAGNSTAANRVVGGYGMATLMKVGTDTWFINGTGVS